MRILFLVLTFCFFSTPAAAIAPDNHTQAELNRIETYLNSLKTLQARFTQTAYDGTQVNGTFYLNRPGKMRFEYDAPITDFIVADGYFVYFYDGELKQQSNAPIGQTLADFILRESYALSDSDEISVKNIQSTGHFTQATLFQTEDPGAGEIMLGFTEEPFMLKRWRILDPQGLITEIELSDVQTNIKIDKDLFYYHDPDKKESDYN